MSDIFENIKQALKEGKPFVAYGKPSSSPKRSIKAHFQKDKTLYFINDYTENGFVFALFDIDKSKPILFPEAECNIIQDYFSSDELKSKTKIAYKKIHQASSQKHHENLVEKALESISKQTFKKVVCSRKIEINVTHAPLDLFQRLLAFYPSAFVYFWHHPSVGTWLGATPESLLQIEDSQLKTMALASTKPFKEGELPQWQSKEINEQALVSKFIEAELSPYLSDLKIGQAQNIRAGKLWHLKSDITGKLTNQNSLQAIIKGLHPTPAVCGLPKDKAKKFILENEGYDRAYYSGFLGELNLLESEYQKNTRKTALFVNLRCMQATTKGYQIYVGGGIVEGSIPKDEWQETVNKSQTMLDIFEKH